MSSEKITVIVDKDLEDLIPGFMQRRRGDVESLKASLSAGEMDKIRVTGHSMKGTGGGYGFDDLSTIGAELEKAAVAGDSEEISALVNRLEQYLDKVVIEFE
ncbi:MAG: Hpt domain-containing protein [Gammaproteobacteria bacterium]|nr:Hpt domain-containing protein [Gammaproteobacteria bacterium]